MRICCPTPTTQTKKAHYVATVPQRKPKNCAPTTYVIGRRLGVPKKFKWGSRELRQEVVSLPQRSGLGRRRREEKQTKGLVPIPGSLVRSCRKDGDESGPSSHLFFPRSYPPFNTFPPPPHSFPKCFVSSRIIKDHKKGSEEREREGKWRVVPTRGREAISCV